MEPTRVHSHTEERKLMPTFDLLTSNSMGDQELSCTIHLPYIAYTIEIRLDPAADPHSGILDPDRDPDHHRIATKI